MSLVPVLDGTNYQDWAAAMQSFLMSQGQWKVISRPGPQYIYKAEDLEKDKTPKAGAIAENVEIVEAWNDIDDKALGNIRLRLNSNIRQLFKDMDISVTLWEQIKSKYGKPGLGQAFIEFKAAMNTFIPPNSNPAPALDKIMTHFARLLDVEMAIPSNVQSMIILAKAPPAYEMVVQSFCADGLTTKKADNVCQALIQSWATHNRTGTSQNQQRANRLSTVKCGGEPPQFQQQQQGNNQQRSDGQWQGRGRGRRGKRGGQKNAQQQLQQAPAQMAQPEASTSEAPLQYPPIPQFQIVPGPSSSSPFLGHFAQRAEVNNPPPNAQSVYPTFQRAFDLAKALDVRPSIETLKTLEEAELNKPAHKRRRLGHTQGLEARITGSKSSSKGKERADKSERVSLFSLGAKGHLPSGYSVSLLWVL